MYASLLRNIALSAGLAAACLLGPGDGTAQPARRGPATDFRFDSAFAVDPPDPVHWEPPPGGFLEDGRYSARVSDGGSEIFLTFGTEFSGAFLDRSSWQSDAFILSYHEQLLAAELSDFSDRGISRIVSAASARLDQRFSLPAIERRILLDEVSRSTGNATRTFVNYSWRFPHPDSPIIEFVVSVSTVIQPGAPIPEITAEQLGFLASLEALPLDVSPDRSIPLGARRLDAIAEGHDALWVTDDETGTLHRVDPQTSGIAASIPVGSGPHSIAITEHAVWVTSHNDDSIARIDPVDNSIRATAGVPTGPHQIVDHSSGLWLVADASCLIAEIDRDTARPTGSPLGFGEVRRSLSGRRERLWGILGQRVGRCTDLSITMAESDTGGLYVFERFKGVLSRIDTGPDVEPVETKTEIGGFLITQGNLWGVDDLDAEGNVYRIDIGSGRVLATIEGGRVSGTPVYGGGMVWVAREGENSIIRIDPATNSIIGSPIPVDSPAGMIAVDDGIWVAGAGNIVHIPFE